MSNFVKSFEEVGNERKKGMRKERDKERKERIKELRDG